MRKNFEIIKKCDLCGSKKYDLFLKAPDRCFESGNYTYVKCKKCGLIWLLYRPTGKALQRFYPENYQPYTRLHSTNKLQKLVRFIIKKNKFIAKILIADQLFFLPKGKLLDVGPGSGYILHVLTDWGWQVTGLELSNKAIKVLKKSGFKNVYQGDIFSHKFSPNSFDLVRYSLVMEHVASPRKELELVKKVLNKRGKVLIIVPNIDSIFFSLFKDYWYPLEPPRHFYQFSPSTLTRLLKSLNFKNIKINYTQSPHPFIWSIFYRLGLKKSDIRFGYLSWPLMFLLKFAVLLKKSDIIEVTAVKG